ncbi:MAG: leucine-rich repeat protein [Clostridia bacterium]|nr:leucine-rich repeat protein [Clostridia bacterium]
MNKRISIVMMLAAAVVLMLIGTFTVSASVERDADLARSVEFINLTNGIDVNQLNGLMAEMFSNEIVDITTQTSDDQEYWTIIRTEGVSLVDAFNSQTEFGSIEEFINSSEAASILRNARRVQQRVIQAIAAAGVKAEYKYSYETVFCGLAVRVRYGDLSLLSRLDGVISVDIAMEYTVPEVSAEAQAYLTSGLSGLYDDNGMLLNESEYLGDGMLVAILDTGLDYLHPAFTQMPTGQLSLTNSDISGLSQNLHPFTSGLDSGFTSDMVSVNDKVIYGFDYADFDMDVIPSATSVQTLGNSHGTHVAGIISGNGDTIRGVVPNAQLAIMKVFSDVSPNANFMDIAAALDDAVLLGADVINMSLGSPCGFSREVYAQNEYINEAFDSLKEAGITLITSCGNYYSTGMNSYYGSDVSTNPDNGTVGMPGTYDAALNTASVDKGLIPYLRYEKNPIFFYDAANSQGNLYNFVEEMLANEMNKAYEFVYIPGGGVESSYENIDVTGKIAVTQRGFGLSFQQKQLNASNKGAIACLVYNNTDGLIRMQIDELSIPTAGISLADGLMLEKAGTGIINFSVDNYSGPYLSDFSSWGPTPDLKLKPEITAPGGAIYSSVPSSSGAYYVEMSGTSMASPNMAGAATAVRQYVKSIFPHFTAKEVRAMVYQLVMSTSSIVVDTNGVPASVRKQGSGIMNLDAALSTTAVLTVNGTDKTKLELGDDKDKEGKYNLRFNLMNFGDTDLSYLLDLTLIAPQLGIDGFSLNGLMFEQTDYSVSVKVKNGEIDGMNVRVKAGMTAEISLSVVLGEQSRAYFDNNFKYGWYIEGFVSLLAANKSGVDISIPFLGFYGDWTEAPIFDATIYDEEKALVYPVAPIAVFNRSDLIKMGTYVYVLPEGAKEVAPDADKNAISVFSNCASEFVSVYFGLLRNCYNLTYYIEDAYNGTVYMDSYAPTARKSYVNSNTAHNLGFSPSMLMLANNQKVIVTITAELAYDEPIRNVKDSISFPVYIDFEAPTLIDAKIREENGRTYADFEICDNHYLMNMQFYTMNAGNELIPIDDYARPIYEFERNSNNIVTIDVTDYMSKLINNKLTFVLQDYAMNYSVYSISMDEQENIGNSTGNGEKSSIQNTDKLEINSESSPSDFVISNGTITAYTGNAEHVIIPDGVTAIRNISTMANGIFAYHDEIKKVSFPQSLTSIGGCAFAYCKNLSEMEFPTKLVYLRQSAFYGCASLTEIYIPDSVTYMANGVFYECSSLKTVRLSPNCDLTYGWLFDGTAIEEVVIPEGITTIAQYVFGHCGSLKKVVLPSTLTSIGSGAFLNDNKLSEINLENTKLVSIGNNAFQYVKGITDLRLPSTLMVLESAAFVNCINIRSVNLEDTKIAYVGESMFYNSSLQSVKLPSTVTAIQSMAFRFCTQLVKVELSPRIQSIGLCAFEDCGALKYINLEDTALATIGSNAFYKCSSLAFVELPDTVTSLGQRAFDECFVLKSITLNRREPAAIGANAFSKTENGRIYVPEGCVAAYSRLYTDYVDRLEDISVFTVSEDNVLTSYSGKSRIINLPLKIKAIGAEAFAYSDLQELYTGYKLTAVEDRAFYYCKSLVLVHLAEGVSSIGNEAFASCSLRRLNLFGHVPPVLGKNAFLNVPSGYSISVPTGSLDAYANAEGWKELVAYLTEYTGFIIENGVLTAYEGAAKQVVIPNGVHTIGSKAFANTAIEGIIFGADVKTVLARAFYGCINLSDVTFNDGLVTIGDEAFYKSGLTSVTLPNTVTSVGSSCFSNCTKLAVVNWSSNCPTIPDRCFFECTALGEFNSFEYVHSISGMAFVRNLGFTEIILPANVTALGSHSFNLLENVTSVEIYGDFSGLYNSFTGMNALNTVSFYGNIGTIGSYMNEYNVDFSGIPLKTVHFYGNIGGINGSAFSACPELEEVYFHKDLGYLDFFVFNSCPKLTTVYFAGRVDYIAGYVSNAASMLKRWTVDANNPYLTVDEYGVMYDKAMTRVYKQPSAWDYDGIYVMPSTVVTIDENAFSYDNALYVVNAGSLDPGSSVVGGNFDWQYEKPLLKGVVLSSNVKEIPNNCFLRFSGMQSLTFDGEAPILERIGDYAFYYCKSLVTVTLPEGLMEIGSYAFYSCESIEKLDLPESLVTIGGSAFALCVSLREIYIPSNIKNLDFYSVFAGCDSLNSIIVAEDNPYFTIIDGVLFNKEMTTLILYSVAKTDTEYIVPEGVLFLAPNSFGANKALTKVTLPKSLLAVGDRALYGVDNLKEVICLSSNAPVLNGLWRKKQDYYYDNFVDNIEADLELTLYRPQNGKFYDNFIWTSYFKTIYATNDQGENILLNTSAKHVEGLISKLGNVSYTTNEVYAAKQAYGMLSENDKLKVSNYELLYNAEICTASNNDNQNTASDNNASDNANGDVIESEVESNIAKGAIDEAVSKSFMPKYPAIIIALALFISAIVVLFVTKQKKNKQ